MSDLRESGALEQDANSITFLYLKGEDRVNGDPDFVRWYRAKQRGGQTDEGLFGFKRNIGQFSSVNDNPEMMP
jgi:replicative DNA helicase